MDQWRVRDEDAVGVGRLVDFPRLAEEVAEGTWTETDEARGPHDHGWVAIGDHASLEEFLPAKLPRSVRPSQESGLDLTAAIDVTLLLIIFFMIMATYRFQKTLDAPQAGPSEESQGRWAALSEIRAHNPVVALMRDGTITLDDAPMTLAELPGALAQTIAISGVSEVVLDSDDDAEYGLVVAILDSAAEAGVEKVLLLYRPTLEGSDESPR
jgi:biopolymer transport protein ExbD